MTRWKNILVEWTLAIVLAVAMLGTVVMLSVIVHGMNPETTKVLAIAVAVASFGWHLFVTVPKTMQQSHDEIVRRLQDMQQDLDKMKHELHRKDNS